MSPQARCQSLSPLLETLLGIPLAPSKPHFPKFPHLGSCAWFMNQKVYVFGMALSCLQVFLEASMVDLIP